MTVKVLAEASLNGITKDMYLHRGSINSKPGKPSKASWDSSLPFPSKYFFKVCVVFMILDWTSFIWLSHALIGVCVKIVLISICMCHKQF
jgi:hypothetical protein